MKNKYVIVMRALGRRAQYDVCEELASEMAVYCVRESCESLAQALVRRNDLELDSTKGWEYWAPDAYRPAVLAHDVPPETSIPTQRRGRLEA